MNAGKILLIAPASSYSIGELLRSSFAGSGYEVAACDFNNLIAPWKKKVNTQVFRLPYRFREKWDNRFLGDLNREYAAIFDREKPDMVLVYNDSMLLPGTAQAFKKKARLFFYLGDNPFYTFNKPLFLRLLLEADYIFAPDSMWVEQLEMLGVKNVYFAILGWNQQYYFSKEPTPGERAKFSSDLLFIGNSYVQNWGYKRALFLSKFADLDLKIYGSRTWRRWLIHFPELKEKFVLLDKPLPLDQVNTISNCCKLYPVDANPGLLHGLHARIFDCIGSGILPLVEYRKDLDRVFKNVDIPKIFNYGEAAELAKYYLKNDNRRRELVTVLRHHILENFLPEHAIERMVKRISR